MDNNSRPAGRISDIALYQTVGSLLVEGIQLSFSASFHISIGTSPEAICSPGTFILSTTLHLIMGIAGKDRLSSSAGPHFEDEWTGNMALHWAAALGNLELVVWLLKAGSAVDAQNKFGWTALHFAAEGVNVQVVERLLHAGANVDSRDHDNSTPLNKAAFSSNRDVVETLLAAKRRPDIEARDLSGQTPLHSAAIRGKHDRSHGVLKALLAAGADVNAPSRDRLIQEYDGYTPLHLAIFAGNDEAVCMLLKYGASLSTKTVLGKNALDIARKERKILEGLKSRGQDVDESLRTMKDIEMYLLENLNKRGQGVGRTHQFFGRL